MGSRSRPESTVPFSHYPAWIGRSDCRACEIFNKVLFSALSPEDIDSIVSGIYEPIDQLAYHAGTAIYNEGNTDNAIYTIRSGLVKLVRYLPDNSERIIRLTNRADSIGLERLLGKPYGHTAIAIRDVRACRIPIGVIQQFSDNRPRFYLAMMERWATSVFQADDYITLLLSGSVMDRVSRLIRWLASVTESEVENAVHLLSGKDMSAMLALSQESISRSMAELKRNKILRHLKDDIYVYDPDALDRFAHAGYKCPARDHRVHTH